MIADDHTIQLDTQEFLNHLFGYVPGYFEITMIDPDRYHGIEPHIRTDSYELGREIPDWDKLHDYNRRGYSIYYGLTSKRHRIRHERTRSTEKDAWWVPALWAEVDLKAGDYDSIDAIYTALCDLAQPPTVIIHSGGGLHALWRIKPIEVTPDNFAAIKEVLRGIAVTIKGDTSVCELARVFRLPGTINTKSDRGGVVCHVVDAVPGEYTFDQFLDYRALAQPVARPIERDLPSIPTGDAVPHYIEWYAANGGLEHERNNRLNWAAHKLYTDGYPINDAHSWIAPLARSFGLDDREIEATIRSAYSGMKGDPSYVSKRGKLRMKAGDAIKRLMGD